MTSVRTRAVGVLAAPVTMLALLATSSAAQAAPVPFCAPRNEHRTMTRADGLLTVSPEPGTLDATPQTQISILGVSPRRISHVKVLGSRTGVHAGHLEPYSQGDGASFVPDKPFAEGERVTVNLKVRVGRRERLVGWRFSVDYTAGLGASHRNTLHASVPAEPLVQHFRSRPELQPPTVEVTIQPNAARPGFIFMSPFYSGQAGPMILNDRGEVVWFHPVNVGPTAASKATNLQVQTYEGKPVLTWWQDPLLAGGGGRREPEDVIFNSSYEQIATVHAGNGLVPDVHEFRLTPRDTALIAIKHDIRCNLRGVNGTADGSVWDGVIQEVDMKTGLVRWEWNSLDHVSLREAYDSAKFASSSYPFDFFHLNSIEAINGRTLLVSARNTWTMYDIDRRTGLVRWQIGGKHPSFAMGPGTRTAWQHDARIVRAPHLAPHMLEISVFDNGATPKEHPQSRALVEQVDVSHRTVKLLHAYVNNPPVLAGSQGSVEPLSSGDTVVGWGQEPWVTEFDSSSGKIVFDAHLPKAEQSYRALRFPWRGTPASPPAIAVERQGARLAVYASWNGATEVASWRVLEGASASSMAPVASADKKGFETTIDAPASGAVVEAQALDAAGNVIGTSAPTPAA